MADAGSHRTRTTSQNSYIGMEGGSRTTSTPQVLWRHRANSPLVFVVDDNPADRRIIIEALKESLASVDIEEYSTGAPVVKRIRSGHSHNLNLPDLIFLDLNMPGMDGHEVLSLLKKDESYRRIPIVVLSGSVASADVKEAYSNHANCYLQKPSSLDGYLEAIGDCARLWLNVAVRPNISTAVQLEFNRRDLDVKAQRYSSRSSGPQQ
jgi:chemotaxis family two-component system response regulator Rcp1